MRKLVMMLLCLGQSYLHAAPAPQIPLAENQDWQLDANHLLCGGYYLPPAFPSELPTDKSLQAPAQISSDAANLRNDGVSVLTGNVIIQDNESRLFADHVSLMRDKKNNRYNWANAKGDLLFERANARFWAQNGRYNMDKQQVLLNQTSYHLYDAHARGQADSMAHTKDAPYFLEQTSYTTCAPGSSLWHVQAKKLKLDTSSNLGQAQHAILYMGNIPVLYSPYFAFPIGNTRTSGFLPPSFGTSTEQGETLSIPYYFNLAPNYDDTLTTTYMRKRGLHLANEFRYLTEYHEGMLQTEIAPNDNEFTQFQNRVRNTPEYTKNDQRFQAVDRASSSRKSLFYTNKTKFNTYWDGDINYQYVSDDNYFSDFKSTLIDSNQRELNRRASLTFHNRYLQVSSLYQNYRVLQPYESDIIDEPFILSPQVKATVTLPTSWENLQPTADMQYTRFVAKKSFANGSTASDGQRLLFTPSITYNYRLPYAYFTPSIGTHSLFYDLNLNNTDKIANRPNSPSVTVPTLSVKTGLFFERETTLFGKNISQSLEPALNYEYIGYKNQNDLPNFDTSFTGNTVDSFTQSNRFNGYDRIGDTNKLTYSVSSEYLNNDTYDLLGDWEIGQSYYFRNRRVALCNTDTTPSCLASEDPTFADHRSDLFARSTFYLTDHLTGSARGQWQPTSYQIDSYDFDLSYEVPDYLLFETGYYGRKTAGQDQFSQFKTALSWQLSPNWHILGYAYRDISEGYYVETFTGLEYEGCCSAFRLGKRRYLKPNEEAGRPQFDNTIFFEIMLKGLGGVGKSHATYLESAFNSYQDHFGKQYY